MNLLLVQGCTLHLRHRDRPGMSLVVEMGFYLALPLLAALAALLAARTASGRRRPWLTALAPAGVLLVLGQRAGSWRTCFRVPEAAPEPAHGTPSPHGAS